jgi:predicted Rossmann fold flavoprotein
VLLDGARKPGAKILVSGGSRCNVTNAIVRDTDFWTAGRRTIVRRILRALPVPDTVAWFRDMGVSLHEEEGGKLFPDSNRARDVLEALLTQVEATGASLVAGTRVAGLARRESRFDVITTHGVMQARAVVLATGGRSLPKTGSDGAGYGMAERLGHTIVPTTPALAPLTLADDGDRTLHATLSGVAQPVELSVWVDGSVAIRFRGPMLWTHFGVSGPVALDASRHWERARLEGRTIRVTVSFVPGLPFGRIDAQLTALGVEQPRTAVRTALARWLPASVAQHLPASAGLDPGAVLSQLPRDARRLLSRALVEWELPVTGTRGYRYAEATAGGVTLSEIDPTTMESRVCPSLYLVGEVLDVDGRLGGFNFQWAWATGRVAARGLAARFAPQMS